MTFFIKSFFLSLSLFLSSYLCCAFSELISKLLTRDLMNSEKKLHSKGFYRIPRHFSVEHDSVHSSATPAMRTAPLQSIVVWLIESIEFKENWSGHNRSKFTNIYTLWRVQNHGYMSSFMPAAMVSVYNRQCMRIDGLKRHFTRTESIHFPYMPRLQHIHFFFRM